MGVPGNLRLAELAHREHGKLPWAALFKPAIALARGGFQITPRLHDALESGRATGARDADGRALFYGADGAALPAGATVHNPALAATLETLAGKGVGRLLHRRCTPPRSQPKSPPTPPGHAR